MMDINFIQSKWTEKEGIPVKRFVPISEHVWRIPFPIIPMNVWLVREQEGLVLVDAGLPFMAGRILAVIEQLKMPLRAILLTHGHPDHVGSINKIRRRFSVPVYAHAEEIPYLSGSLPYYRKKTSKQVLPASELTPLPIDTEQSLTAVHGLEPHFTPGHSPGHVAYFHRKDGVLMAGDLFTTRKKILRRPAPMYTPDMKQAIMSGEIVKKLKPQIVTLCHGEDISDAHEQFDVYKDKWLPRAFRIGG